MNEEDYCGGGDARQQPKRLRVDICDGGSESKEGKPCQKKKRESDEEPHIELDGGRLPERLVFSVEHKPPVKGKEEKVIGLQVDAGPDGKHKVAEAFGETGIQKLCQKLCGLLIESKAVQAETYLTVYPGDSTMHALMTVLCCFSKLSIGMKCPGHTAGTARTIVGEELAKSTRVRDLRLMDDQAWSVCSYLVHHPTLQIVQLSRKGTFGRMSPDGLRSLLSSLQAISTIPNIIGLDLDFRLLAFVFGSTSDRSDLGKMLFSTLPLGLKTMSLGMDLDVNTEACRAFGLAIKNSDLNYLRLGEYIRFHKTDCILDGLADTQALRELCLCTSSFLVHGSQDDELLERYFSHSTTLTSLTLRARKNPQVALTILRALAHNTNLKKLSFHLENNHQATRQLSKDLQEALVCIAIGTGKTSELQELQVSSWSNYWYRDSWGSHAMVEWPWAGASNLRSLAWCSHIRLEENDEVVDLVKLVRGWTQVLRCNTGLQNLEFPQHQLMPTPKPKEEDFATMEEFDGAMRGHLHKAHLLEQVVPLEEELKGWLTINCAQGNLRQKFHNNPLEVSKTEAVKLLGAATDFPTCSFSLLKAAPATFIGNGHTT